MKHLLIWLGLVRPAPLKHTVRYNYTVSFSTTHPPAQPSYQEWVKEFRVSMLHNREAVHF